MAGAVAAPALVRTDRIPLAVPDIGPLEGAYLQQCVEETFVSSVGPFVTRFELEIGALSGTGPAAATGSGTQALHLALHTLGVGHGDLVIAPSFTFIASANAVAQCGALPWLLDVRPDCWTLDPAEVERALAEETERTSRAVVHKRTGRRVAAIMPVHTLGRLARMAELGEIATDHGLPLVADAAAALGATSAGRPTGAAAALTAYSFNGNKTITCGGGGALVGPDAAIVARARHLSATARVSRDYDHDEVAFNYRMTNLQAAVGCAQLTRLDAFLAAKAQIRRRYDEGFADIAGAGPFPSAPAGESVHWLSGLVIEDDALPGVAAVCNALAGRGIEARPFWKPVHLQRPYRDAPRGPLPVTDRLWSRIVTLPSSSALSGGDQARVVEAVRTVLAR